MSFIPFVGHDRGYLSVRAGGHDTAGRALSEGVVIDLSQMRTVTVDQTSTAHVQAGATISDLIETTTIWVGDSDRNLLRRWHGWIYPGRIQQAGLWAGY